MTDDHTVLHDKNGVKARYNQRHQGIELEAMVLGSKTSLFFDPKSIKAVKDGGQFIKVSTTSVTFRGSYEGTGFSNIDPEVFEEICQRALKLQAGTVPTRPAGTNHGDNAIDLFKSEDGHTKATYLSDRQEIDLSSIVAGKEATISFKPTDVIRIENMGQVSPTTQLTRLTLAGKDEPIVLTGVDANLLHGICAAGAHLQRLNGQQQVAATPVSAAAARSAPRR